MLARLCRGRRGLALVVRRVAPGLALGQEFIPSLDEGDIAMHAMRIPGTSLTPVGRRCRTCWSDASQQFPR